MCSIASKLTDSGSRLREQAVVLRQTSRRMTVGSVGFDQSCQDHACLSGQRYPRSARTSRLGRPRYSPHHLRQLQLFPHRPPDLFAGNTRDQGLIHSAALEFLQSNGRRPASGIALPQRSTQSRPQFRFAHVNHLTQQGDPKSREPYPPRSDGPAPPVTGLTTPAQTPCTSTSQDINLGRSCIWGTSYPKWPTAKRLTFSYTDLQTRSAIGPGNA